MRRLITIIIAFFHARRIMKSLKEAEDIHAAKKIGKSFAEFLNELEK